MHPTIPIYIFLLALFIPPENAKIVVSKQEYLSMPDLFHLDNFDRCMLYEERALYCKLSFQLAPLDAQNATRIWNTIETVSSEETNYRHDLLRHGVCVPDSCPNIRALLTEPDKLKSGLNECYRAKYGHLGLTGHITDLHCLNNQPQYPIGAGHVLFAVVVGLYAAFFVVANAYEGLAESLKTKEEYGRLVASKWWQVVCAFSISRNWSRFSAVDESNKEIDSFRFIQGIRFYNMALVIFTHTAMINLAVPVSNPLYAETLADKAFTVLLSCGGLAMQTTFAVSGALLTYGILKTFENKNDIPLSFLPLALLYRFVRLTPVLVLLWAFKSTWMVHSNSGPLWEQLMGEEYRRCSHHGWINLLYMNNYFYKTDMCMGHTWYLACDTQFFILTIVLLKFIKRNEKRIYWIVAGILAFNIIVTFVVLYTNQWEFVMRTTPELVYNVAIVDNPKWHIIFASNYFNLTGMVAGLIVGYILHKTRNTPLFNTKSQVTLWWMVTWFMGVAIAIIPGLIRYAPGYEPNWLYNALFGSVVKVFFIVSVIMGMVGFANGVGWCFLWTLNWRPMYMLGRLTYGAYVIHETTQKTKAAVKRELTYLSDFTIFTDGIGDICLSYLVALVLHIMLELPTSQLIKVLTEQKKDQKDGENKNK